jgi:OTU domain-containing protein 6
MRDHKDDFIAFLPSVGGEDTAEATEDGMMTDKGFEKYCRMVAETGEWGGEPEVS